MHNVVLKWDQQQRQKTIYIQRDKSNVATLWSYGGHKRFDDSVKLAMMVNVLLDAEVIEEQQPTQAADPPDESIPDVNTQDDDNVDEDEYEIEQFHHLGNQSVLINGIRKRVNKDPSHELLVSVWAYVYEAPTRTGFRGSTAATIS